MWKSQMEGSTWQLGWGTPGWKAGGPLAGRFQPGKTLSCLAGVKGQVVLGCGYAGGGHAS